MKAARFKFTRVRISHLRLTSFFLLLALAPAMASADKLCEAVFKEAIYDAGSFLSLERIEKSTREIACKARKDDFTFYYSGRYLNIATMTKRCNSSYDKVTNNQYDAQNLETVYNAVLASWASCLKTTEGLKHWASSIRNAPAKFTYLLDYDARSGPDSVDVSIDMQPQSVWKSCKFRDGSQAKNPVKVTRRKIGISCNRDPDKPVNIAISTSRDVPTAMPVKLVLPVFKAR